MGSSGGGKHRTGSGGTAAADIIGDASVEQLSRQILEEHIRNLRQHNELRQLVASGVVEQRMIDDTYRGYAREVEAHYQQRLAEASIRYYAQLLALANEYSRQFFDRTLAAFTPGRAGALAATPAALELSGTLGEHVEGRFELSNQQAVPVDVSFLVSPLTGPDGEMFRPSATLTPATYQLMAGEVREIALRVALERGMYEPGHTYTGTVEVVGHPGVVLSLRIGATEGSPAGPDPEPRAARVRAKRSPATPQPTSTRRRGSSRPEGTPGR